MLITRQRTLNSPRVHPIFAPAARVSRSKPDPRDSHRTTQVRNAEMAGAVAVVVFDNVDGPLTVSYTHLTLPTTPYV